MWPQFYWNSGTECPNNQCRRNVRFGKWDAIEFLCLILTSIGKLEKCLSIINNLEHIYFNIHIYHIKKFIHNYFISNNNNYYYCYIYLLKKILILFLKQTILYFLKFFTILQITETQVFLNFFYIKV